MFAFFFSFFGDPVNVCNPVVFSSSSSSSSSAWLVLSSVSVSKEALLLVLLAFSDSVVSPLSFHSSVMDFSSLRLSFLLFYFLFDWIASLSILNWAVRILFLVLKF